MRKIFLGLTICNLVIAKAQSQWTTNGSNIYNSNAGNVGIGTSAPSTKLTVAGTGTSITLTDNSATQAISGFFNAKALQIINTESNGVPSLAQLDANKSTTRPQFIISNSGDGQWANNFLSMATHGTTFSYNGQSDYYLSDGVSDAGLALLWAQGSNVSKFAIGTYDSKPMSLFTGNVQRLYITSTGNVGVGNLNPQSKFAVDGDIRAYDNSANRSSIGAAWGGANIGYGTGFLAFNLSRNNQTDGSWSYYSDGANNGGNVIYGNVSGDINFSCRPTTGNSSGLITDVDIVNNIKMKIMRDGKVVVGANGLATPDGYKLYVQDGILTEKVKVALKTTGNWSDYVFKNDYKLMPLDEVKNFIDTKHHLPNVPSAEEMVIQGNDLAKTDAKLLEKIEELTLYTINLNEERKELQTQINNLKKEIFNLKLSLSRQTTQQHSEK